MVDKTPPVPHGPDPTQGPDASKKSEKVAAGSFNTQEEHKFVGLTFTAKDWNKLMDTMLRSLSDYINKTFQKMTDKMKEDWKRGRGEDQN